jgi:hypothetical protein
VITDLAGDLGTKERNLVWPVTVTPATGGFFNGLNHSAE